MNKKIKKPALRIQPRDIEIFDWLYKLRFLTAKQIAGLVEAVEEKVALPEYNFAQGYHSIIKRIKLLTKTGYLECIKQPFQKYLYTLTPEVIDILVLEKGIPRENIAYIFNQKKQSQRNLEHSFMIAEFGAILALAVKKRSDIKLLTWLSETAERQIEIETLEDVVPNEVRKLNKKQSGPQIKFVKKPDAIFGLEDEKGIMFFMLEADKGTEITARILEKMTAYYHFLADGHFNDWSVKHRIRPDGQAINTFRVITYTVTPQWQQTLTKKILKVNSTETGSKMFWFTNQSLTNSEQPEKIFDPIFSIAQKDESNQLHSILEYG